MPYSHMVDELKAWLRKPEGAQDLSETIERSYMNSFGRAPSPSELGYWVSEVKAKHYGYSHIVDYSRAWLKTAAGSGEREPLIERAYKRAFGRPAKPNEVSYWRAQIGKDGTNFTDLVEKCVSYMLGSSPEQLGELSDTIRRAHKALGRPAPGDAQMKYWISQTSAGRLTYEDLVRRIR